MMNKIGAFKTGILKLTKERAKHGIPTLPLNVEQVSDLCSIIKTNEFSSEDGKFLKHQLIHRVMPGVDETSYIKAQLLNDICNDTIRSSIINNEEAIRILGTMQGGYNVEIMTKLLENDGLGKVACKQLENTILIFDNFYKVEQLYKSGNPYAKSLLHSWADAEWFARQTPVPDKITCTVFKVPGETNTDDLSPAQDAWSRPDIPLHSLCMLKNPRDGIVPDYEYETGPMKLISELKDMGNPVAYVGDVVGTGSSRKSATNSILWHFGNDIQHVPNKKNGGLCFGNKIAPIFLNTMEDSGALPIEMDVYKMSMGQSIDVYPYEGIVIDTSTKQIISEWTLPTETLLDSVRAKGRINLIIGKGLTHKAQQLVGKHDTSIFIQNKTGIVGENTKYTLAQKMVGAACNQVGIEPGTYCEPLVTSVGSQDTTGPMTRDELKDLACLGFSSDLVMQSFCHTAAYPKPVDVVTHNTLPEFIENRGGISLKPGDGIIHSWLNRMLLPDTLGTGGDSHTRFPIGISFPAGSGLVAFAAATGTMPLEMPESVLVRFNGTMRPGITLRDLVHAIPYYAKQRNLLTIEKQNKKNVFNGRILEIEGLPDLTCEQAFELSDASAERSAAGCTIKLNKEPVIEYLESNIALLEWMVSQGYNDKTTIKRRIGRMQEWLANPVLMEADAGATYAEVIEIDLDEIEEPILCAPNDPDDAVKLSEVSGQAIDEVFIGSCMTNIGHFRATGKLLESHRDKLGAKLWIAPPTKMDEAKLQEEGYYEIYDRAGVQTEMPGCSLCMGNQARVEDGAYVLSTSTRNFPNRLGKGAKVFLASAELSAITAIEGRIPTYEEYIRYFSNIQEKHEEIFDYMQFDKLEEYVK